MYNKRTFNKGKGIGGFNPACSFPPKEQTNLNMTRDFILGNDYDNTEKEVEDSNQSGSGIRRQRLKRKRGGVAAGRVKRRKRVKRRRKTTKQNRLKTVKRRGRRKGRRKKNKHMCSPRHLDSKSKDIFKRY